MQFLGALSGMLVGTIHLNGCSLHAQQNKYKFISHPRLNGLPNLDGQCFKYVIFAQDTDSHVV